MHFWLLVRGFMCNSPRNVVVLLSWSIVYRCSIHSLLISVYFVCFGAYNWVVLLFFVVLYCSSFSSLMYLQKNKKKKSWIYMPQKHPPLPTYFARRVVSGHAENNIMVKVWWQGCNIRKGVWPSWREKMLVWGWGMKRIDRIMEVWRISPKGWA